MKLYDLEISKKIKGISFQIREVYSFPYDIGQEVSFHGMRLRIIDIQTSHCNKESRIITEVKSYDNYYYD